MSQHKQTIDGDVTWTSSDSSLIDPETGVVASVTTNEVVVLTASYLIDGIEYTTNIEITILIE